MTSSLEAKIEELKRRIKQIGGEESLARIEEDKCSANVQS